MKKYILHLQAGVNKIQSGCLLRVDLIGEQKISEIEELKDYNIRYETSGHEDSVMIKGNRVPRKVRYIKLFPKFES